MNNRHYYYINKLSLFLLLMLFSSVFTSCYKVKPLNLTLEDINKWTKIEQYRSTETIQNLVGTEFEIYTISRSEFARINNADTLIEKRPLSLYNGVIGRPILSENFFVRFANDGGKDVIEFHSARNPSAKQVIIADDLKNSNDNKIEIDRSARLSGAFNEDETQFVLLTVVNFKYSALYFDIVPTMDYNDFVSITPSHRIDFPMIEDGIEELQVVRFIDGFYYVGTKSAGGYRLSENGTYTQVLGIGNWVLDFFKKDNRIIATNFNSYSQRTSLDNGETFLPSTGDESKLQEIEVVGDTIFTQQSVGFAWKMSLDVPYVKTKNIYYNEEIAAAGANNNVYNGIGYLNGKFYISVDKDIYYVDEVSVKEE